MPKYLRSLIKIGLILINARHLCESYHAFQPSIRIALNCPTMHLSGYALLLAAIYTLLYTVTHLTYCANRKMCFIGFSQAH